MAMKGRGASLACVGVLLAACGPEVDPGDGPPAKATVTEAARPSAAVLPKPAPRIYRSSDKNLTFPSPAGSFYCPLPDDWIGSDHGTVVFLTPPDRCGGGGGYASSGRGALNASNIQIYYGYDVLAEDEKPPPDPCEEIGKVRFFGMNRPLCITRTPAHVEVRAEAPYMAEGADYDLKAEAAFTLVTSPDRLQTDLETFKGLLMSTGTCNRTDVEDGPTYQNARPACPSDAVWF